MATLYEIDAAILSCIDFETGEILDPEQLEALEMQRDEKIESVALWYKNLLSDAEAYKAEKEAFAEREKAAKNKAESLKKWLTDALGGEKMSTSKVAISFRKSEAVEIGNEDAFIAWAQKSNRDDLLTYQTPKVNKTAVKSALTSGEKIDGANLVKKQNIQIK
jgi:hypothetical protein